MTTTDPALRALVDRVRAAQADGVALDIRGGGTKRFYGEAPLGEPLDVTGVAGVSNHEPSELVVTARCGTLVSELESTLAEAGQCLPFEPPRYGASTTVGGMIAAGLAGPSRAAVGGVRDYVLGATLLNGRAEVLSFGGQVMKNVAGYDISRFLAGSMGLLGVILEVSLKVLPTAPATATLRFDLPADQALTQLNAWGSQPLPINASAWWEGALVVRLRGAAAAVDAARRTLGGELIEPALADAFWSGLRDHTDEYFQGAHRALAVPAAAGSGARLWRLSVPSTTPALHLPGEQLVEWGGAQRWICTTAPAHTLRDAAHQAGGHAVLFAGEDKSCGVFAPLPGPLMRIHRELKSAFDPAGVFNRGRLYPSL